MSSVLQSSYELTENVEFGGRISAALYKASVDISNATADLSLPENKSRLALAQAIKMEPKNYTRHFIWPISNNASIASTAQAGQEAVADGDIEYVVATVYTEIAVSLFPREEVQYPSIGVPGPGAGGNFEFIETQEG